jgi:hypothetical protein
MRTPLLAAVVTALLGLAACGGSGGWRLQTANEGQGASGGAGIVGNFEAFGSIEPSYADIW